MATHGWRTGYSVIDYLKQDASRFNFYQAVRLLERLDHKSGDDTDSENSAQENILIIDHAVLFKTDVRDDFPPSAITSIQFNHALHNMKPVVLLARYGLAGRFGPMPQPYSSWLQDNIAKGDNAMADFLDIFNHRLAALLYLAKKKYRLGLSHSTLANSPPARYINSLFGFGTDHLRNRLPIEHRQLTAFAGLLADSRTSVSAFKNCLAYFFNVEVEINQLQGDWLVLEKDQHTYLGLSGRNQLLGCEAALGTKAWDQQAGIHVRFGPLDINRFLSFLPGYGAEYIKVATLVDFLNAKRWHTRITLLIKQQDIPVSRLNGAVPFLLGRSSWLKSRLKAALSPDMDAQVGFMLKAASV